MQSYDPFMCKYCMLSQKSTDKENLGTDKEILPFLGLAYKAGPEGVRTLHLNLLFIICDCH